jgi:hypothetical protein
MTVPAPPTSASIVRKAVANDLTEGRFAPEKVVIFDIIEVLIEV